MTTGRYCEGGDLLKKMVSEKSFSESTAAHIMKQILAAVEYCHKRQVVHRYCGLLQSSDLKPENIVFEGASFTSTAKVIDFGRSKVLRPREKCREKTGTVSIVAACSSIIMLLRYSLICNIRKSAMSGAVGSFSTS